MEGSGGTGITAQAGMDLVPFRDNIPEEIFPFIVRIDPQLGKVPKITFASSAFLMAEGKFRLSQKVFDL